MFLKKATNFVTEEGPDTQWGEKVWEQFLRSTLKPWLCTYHPSALCREHQPFRSNWLFSKLKLSCYSAFIHVSSLSLHLWGEVNDEGEKKVFFFQSHKGLGRRSLGSLFPPPFTVLYLMILLTLLDEKRFLLIRVKWAKASFGFCIFSMSDSGRPSALYVA